MLAVALLGLLLVVGAGLIFLGAITGGAPLSKSPASKGVQQAASVAPLLKRAQKLLAQGQFHLAASEAETALALGAAASDLSAATRRALVQVQREAKLLADLSATSLEEILQSGPGPTDPEWLADFRQRYRGRAIVLDVQAVRTPDGRYRHTGRLLLDGKQARLALEGLSVLQTIPLQSPRRLLFGARLQDVQVEGNAAWVVRLDPASGVLLTDPDAARLCCPAVADADSARILRQQRALVVEQEPGPPPVVKKE